VKSCATVQCVVFLTHSVHANLHKIFVHVTHGRSSVVFWHRCDMLYNFSLWMTSCLRIMARDRQCEKALCSNWLNREQHGFDTAAYTETDAPGAALVRGGVWYLRLPWTCSGVRMWTLPMAYSRYEVWAERIERPKVARGGSRVQYQSGRKSW